MIPKITGGKRQWQADSSLRSRDKTFHPIFFAISIPRGMVFADG
jgi:hypothetical protein